MLSLTQATLQMATLLKEDGFEEQEIQHVSFDFGRSEFSVTVQRSMFLDTIRKIENKFECTFKGVLPYMNSHGGSGVCVVFTKKSL